MSQHSEFSTLSNRQKDILSAVEKNANTLKWILILAVATFGLALAGVLVLLTR